ncbi:MAG: hypothetical protein Q8S00_12525 [Deltaproteobacteria bacterium]|nr:hypothetical protein [Deltaproteobacteria bacterium]
MNQGKEISRHERRLLQMLRLAEKLAVDLKDGHLTILRFTTHWKIMLGTPEMTIDFPRALDGDITDTCGYGEVKKLPGFDSLEATFEGFLPVDIPLKDECCEG